MAVKSIAGTDWMVPVVAEDCMAGALLDFETRFPSALERAMEQAAG